MLFLQIIQHLLDHVILKDNVVVGALSAIHQFSKIGEGAMIGGMSALLLMLFLTQLLLVIEQNYLV